MAGDFSSVGGIVIPVMVVRTGDKNAISKIKTEIDSLSQTLVQANKVSTTLFQTFNSENKLIKAVEVTRQFNAEIGKQIVNSKQLEVAGKSAYDELLKSLNTVRWSMVNASFLMKAFGDTIGKPFIVGTSEALKFEKELFKISSISGESIANAEKEVMSARQGRPVTKFEVSDAYLELAKSGRSAADSAIILSNALDLAQLSGMGTTEAATELVQILSQFDLSAAQSKGVLDALSTAAAKTVASEQSLTSALGYVGSVAQGTGQDINQIIAILAQLQQKGLDSSKAGTSLRQVLNALIDPSEKAKKAMDELNVSFVDSTTGQFKQLPVFFGELKEALSNLSEGDAAKKLGQMFEVRALVGVQAALEYIKDDTNALQKFTQEIEVTGAAADKVAIQNKARMNTLANATENFKNGFLDAGKAILGTVTPAALQSFEDLGKAMGRLYQGAAEVVSIVGTALVGAFGNIINVIKTITPLIVALSAAWIIYNARTIAATVVTTAQAVATWALGAAEAFATAGVLGLGAALLTGVAIWGAADSLIKRFTTSLDTSTSSVEKQNSALSDTSFVTKQSAAMSELDVIQGRLLAGSSKESGTTIFDKLLGRDKATKASREIDTFTTDVKQAFEQATVAGYSAANKIGSAWASISFENSKIGVAEQEIVKLTATIPGLKSTIQSLTAEQERAKTVLEGYTDAVREADSTLKGMYSATFTGETETISLIKKAENYRKKQELAALGVADAESFIQDSIGKTADEYDTLFAQISKVNSAYGKSTDMFESWKTTIQEEIKAEVQAGQSLGKDVSQRTKVRQTQLLGIQNSTDSSKKQSTGLDDYINKLSLSNEVFYGGMHDEIKNFMAQQTDKENGVFESSKTLLDAIKAEIIVRDKAAADQKKAGADLDSITEKLKGKQTDLETTQTKIANDETLIANIIAKIETQVQDVATIISNLKGQQTPQNAGEQIVSPETLKQMSDKQKADDAYAQDLIKNPLNYTTEDMKAKIMENGGYQLPRSSQVNAIDATVSDRTFVSPTYPTIASPVNTTNANKNVSVGSIVINKNDDAMKILDNVFGLRKTTNDLMTGQSKWPY